MRTSGWDGNHWADGETGNSRDGGGQWDGKPSGRAQDALRRDGRRRQQKPTAGKAGKSRSGTNNHAVSRSRPVPFPSRPLSTVPTFTPRIPDLCSMYWPIDGIKKMVWILLMTDKILMLQRLPKCYEQDPYLTNYGSDAETSFTDMFPLLRRSRRCAVFYDFQCIQNLMVLLSDPCYTFIWKLLVPRFTATEKKEKKHKKK